MLTKVKNYDITNYYYNLNYFISIWIYLKV